VTLDLADWSLTTRVNVCRPVEETGNLFMMILGIVQRQNNDLSWLFPHYSVRPLSLSACACACACVGCDHSELTMRACARRVQKVLEMWAGYLVASLPDPGNQLCTDDFEGVRPVLPLSDLC
jgi:hypothetical protein